MLTKMIGRLNFVLNLIIKFATYLYIINIFIIFADINDLTL